MGLRYCPLAVPSNWRCHTFSDASRRWVLSRHELFLLFTPRSSVNGYEYAIHVEMTELMIHYPPRRYHSEWLFPARWHQSEADSPECDSLVVSEAARSRCNDGQRSIDT